MGKSARQGNGGTTMLWGLKLIGAIGAALLTAGCYSRSFPVANSFVIPDADDCTALPVQCSLNRSLHLFADANGTLYPHGWKSHPVLGKAVRKAGTLYMAARSDPELRRHIDDQAGRQLDEIAARGAAADRIIILVHGYNNNVAEAASAYHLVERNLNLTPKDLVIRFYWDGLTSDNPFGSGRIWFYATGNSQVVGSRGLRKVLQRFHHKNIFLIGHSRGTSVILSALGNPVYNPGFKEKTEALASKYWGINNMLSPAALEINGNNIHVLAAAPAVDRIDFCDSRYQSEADRLDCTEDKMRPLPVRRFAYTVNGADPVLDKFVGLSQRFNPTGLGLRYESGTVIRGRYKEVMKAYCLPPKKMHAFTWYVQQPHFLKMLHSVGLLRPELATRDVTGGTSLCPHPVEQTRR